VTHALLFTVFLAAGHTLRNQRFSLSTRTRSETCGTHRLFAHARPPAVLPVKRTHAFQIRRRLLLYKHTLREEQFPLLYHTRWAIYSFCLHAHAQSSAGFLSSWRTLISGQFSLWRYTRLYTRRLPLLLLRRLWLKQVSSTYSTCFQCRSCFRQVTHALQGAVFPCYFTRA
jgi:hypothetical protein